MSDNKKKDLGSISIGLMKEATKEFIDTLIKDTELKDGEDDDIVHLFQCREECTDINYRPPELFMEQISNLKLCPYKYEKNGYYYIFSANVLDFYGKGKTVDEAQNNFRTLITKSLRCGKGGIYPLCSPSAEYESIVCKSMFEKLNDDDEHNCDIMESSNEFNIDDISARALRRLLQRLLKCKSKLCTLSSYNEWVLNGCPLYNHLDDFYSLSLENGNIVLSNINVNDTNSEKICFTYHSITLDKLNSVIKEYETRKYEAIKTKK